MNIKSESPSDNQGSEEVIAARRTSRPKKCIDWGFLKSSRKKRKKPEESENKEDGISIDLYKGISTSIVHIKQEKLPVEEFELGKGIQDAYFNFGKSNLTSGRNNGISRVSQQEEDQFSESTVSVYSDNACHLSSEENNEVFKDHSYAASPAKKKKKRQVEPKKERIETEIAPRPSVDIATLAIYRALIDHTYSSISPSSLIDAVMLKHHYICSIQHHEFHDSSKTVYAQGESYDNIEKKKDSESPLHSRSLTKKTTNSFKKGGRPNKVKASSDQQQANLAEDPIAKEFVENLVENPKYRRKYDSPKRTPQIKCEKRGTPLATPKLTTVKRSKSQKNKRNTSPIKDVEEDEKLESSSMSSKSGDLAKTVKKRRRRNQTGWPTKYKPQLNKSKPSTDKTETRMLKNQSHKKDEIKNSSSSAHSSPKKRQKTDVKLEKNKDQALLGVGVSVGESVKKRRTLKESEKESVSTSLEMKVRERRKVKSLYQRRENESSKKNQRQNISTPKKTRSKTKSVSSLKEKIVSCIKPESHSSEEADSEGATENENISSSESQEPRRKITTRTLSNTYKSSKRSRRRLKSEVIKSEDEKIIDCVSEHNIPNTNFKKSCDIIGSGERENVESKEVVLLQDKNYNSESLKRSSSPSTCTATETSDHSSVGNLTSSPKTSVVRPANRFSDSSSSSKQKSNETPPQNPADSISNSSPSSRFNSQLRVVESTPRKRKTAENQESRSLVTPLRETVISSTSGGERENVESKEVVLLQHNSYNSESLKRSSSPSTCTATETTDHSPVGSLASSPKTPVVRPANRFSDSSSPSKQKSNETPSQNPADSISNSSPSSRSSSQLRVVESTRPKRKTAENQDSHSSVTPLRETAVSSSSKRRTRASRRFSPEHKSSSAANYKSDANIEQPLNSNYNKDAKNIPKTCENSSLSSVPNSPIKETDPKDATEGIDNTSSFDREAVNIGDTEGSLVPNPKARMNLRKRAKLQVSSLFKPRYSSKTKSTQSSLSKLSKIKEEVTEEDGEISRSNVDKPPVAQGKSKKRRKKLFWGHRRKNQSKEVPSVKLSSTKHESFKESKRKSLKNLPNNKEDETVFHPPAAGNETSRAGQDLAVIKVETMDSKCVYEDTGLDEPGESTLESHAIADKSKHCLSTSNQDSMNKIEIPVQDSLDCHSESESLLRENDDSYSKDLSCKEQFQDIDFDSNNDEMYTCGSGKIKKDPEMVFPPLENLDYTGWENTKTICTSDVSDSDSEDRTSIPEEVDRGEVASSPSSNMGMFNCSSSKARSETRLATLKKNYHLGLKNPSFDDKSSRRPVERAELEDDPTSNILDSRKYWIAKMKRRAKLRKRRQQRLKLRAKRHLLMRKRTAVARNLRETAMLGTEVKKYKSGSSFAHLRGTLSPQQHSRNLHEGSRSGSSNDPLIDIPSKYHRVVDLTQSPDRIQTAVRKMPKRILKVAPSILRGRSIYENATPLESVKEVEANEVELYPYFPMPASPLVISNDEIHPVFPKPLFLESGSVSPPSGMTVQDLHPSISPKQCTDTSSEQMRSGVVCPDVPGNSKPCTVSRVRCRVFKNSERSPIMGSIDADEIQGWNENGLRPASPIVIEDDMTTLDANDTLPDFPKISTVKANENLKGTRKMGSIGTRASTIRGIAVKESLQINNEHAYCRKNKPANNAALCISDSKRYNVRISDGKLDYNVGEQTNYTVGRANYTEVPDNIPAAERQNYSADRVNHVAEKLITKNFPLIIKQKPITVKVPKTVTVPCINEQFSKQHSPDPYDLSGIVAPLSTPNPADISKIAVKSYAPGGCLPSKKPASNSQKTPIDPLENIWESSNVVSNSDRKNHVKDHDDSSTEKNTSYLPPPEIARLDVLVRHRLKLPTDAVPYVLRKDGRPPFSYQTLAAMAIEADPLKSARAGDVFDFMVKHFPFYQNITSRWWKHNLRTMLSTSKIFRSDRIGCHVYYSFIKELRLPGDPAIYEMTDEPPEDSDQSEEDEEDPTNDECNDSGFNETNPFDFPQVNIQEPNEINPLIPICSYSDDDADDLPVNVDIVTNTDDLLSTPAQPETSDHEETDIYIKEEPEEELYSENEPRPCMASTSPAANHDRVYTCTYCPAVFCTLQGSLDHSVIHPEVMKPCPQCDFSSPDEVQLLWHVNSAHPD